MRKWEGKLLWMGSFLFLLFTLKGIGLTWDEPFYMLYPQKYFEWFSHPKFSSIEKFFPDEVHPPLGKYIIGTSIRLFSWFLPPLVAARVSIILLSASFIYLTYWIGKAILGREAGIFSALNLLLMPRVFGHMHLATLDITLSLFFLLATWAFYRGLEEIKWSLLFGVIWGLCISVKASGLFLLPPLILWSILAKRKDSLKNFFFAFTISPLLFFLLWPRMWVHTFFHLRQYIYHQIYRLHIPVYYFGKVYTHSPPPWHYPWIMLLFTLPPVTLFLIFLGLRKIKGNPDLQIFIFPPLFFLFLVSLPQAEKYDGIRLFLPVFPFLSILAGCGFKFLYSKIKNRGFLLLLPSFVSLLLLHPYYLSYYNLLCGGLKGAERLGMEITYWGDAMNMKVFNFINTHSPPFCTISFYPAGHLQTKFYSILGFLKGGRKGVDTIRENSFLIVLQRREGLFNEKCRKILKESKPLYCVEKDGVWLVYIFKGKVD